MLSYRIGSFDNLDHIVAHCKKNGLDLFEFIENLFSAEPHSGNPLLPKIKKQFVDRISRKTNPVSLCVYGYLCEKGIIVNQNHKEAAERYRKVIAHTDTNNPEIVLLALRKLIALYANEACFKKTAAETFHLCAFLLASRADMNAQDFEFMRAAASKASTIAVSAGQLNVSFTDGSLLTLSPGRNDRLYLPCYYALTPDSQTLSNGSQQVLKEPGDLVFDFSNKSLYLITPCESNEIQVSLQPDALVKFVESLQPQFNADSEETGLMCVIGQALRKTTMKHTIIDTYAVLPKPVAQDHDKSELRVKATRPEPIDAPLPDVLAS